MHLPSLKNIEAFEAAAKHLNFTEAGADLNITSAAVSQRVASLEEMLGQALFRRRGPILELTEYGRISQPVLRQALGQVRNAIGSLYEISNNDVLTIKVSPSLAQKWLVPRLGQFSLQHPKIDLRIWSTTDRIAVDRGELCMAICYGTDPAKGLGSDLTMDHLFDERVFPVCSPKFAARQEKFDSLEDLKRVTLLHDDTTKAMQIFPDWRRWFNEFGVHDVDTTRGPRYVVSSVAVQAAIEGQGVCLARGALVRDDLASGTLIRPFPEAYPITFEYFFVYPKVFMDRPAFKIFHQWLLERAEQYKERPHR